MWGYLSESMHAGRISAHGKITSLAADFKLKNNVPFSIFIVPKDVDAELKLAETISVMLYQEDTHSDCPFTIGAWNEPSIVSIEANATLLDDYDVYWGAGQIAEEV